MDTNLLIHRLQLLQNRLCEMASDLSSLTDPQIVAVSEEADCLIVQLQRIRREEADTLRRKKLKLSEESMLTAAQASEEIGQQNPALFLKHS
jgi:hypothetical protein